MTRNQVCALVWIFSMVFVDSQPKNCDLKEKQNQYLSSSKPKNLNGIPKQTDPHLICPVHKIEHRNKNQQTVEQDNYRNPYGYFYNNDYQKLSSTCPRHQPQPHVNGLPTYINQPELFGQNIQPFQSCQKIPESVQNWAGTLLQNCNCKNGQCEKQIGNCEYLSPENYYQPLGPANQPFFNPQNYLNFYSNPYSNYHSNQEQTNTCPLLSNLDKLAANMDTNSKMSKACLNPNCNCQNCKCHICQCASISSINRDKRELSFDKECCSNPSYNCKKSHSPLLRSCKNPVDNCRKKRQISDFGQSVSKFFTNIFPKQFKHFHDAVFHMNSPTSKSKYRENAASSKFSLLDQLENIHQKNNPQIYSQPKLGQKYYSTTDVSQKLNDYNTAQRFQADLLSMIPRTKKFATNNNLPPFPQKHVMKSQYPVSPLLEMKYKKFRQELEPIVAQNAPKYKKSNVALRYNTKNEVDPTVLLRKLKRLNGNLLNQNFREQATDYMTKCLVPNKINPNKKKFGTRNGKFNENNIRQKRTIILGSDELDLPTHYEIEVVSDEEAEEDPRNQILGNRNNNFYINSYEQQQEDSSEQCSCENVEEQSFEQLQGYNDYYPDAVLQKTNRQPAPVLQGKYPSLLPKRNYMPSLVKPDVLIGKNVVKRIVQEELNNYQKKVEREQRLNQMKEKRNNMFGHGKNGIPQNPIFTLFNAPVDFLRQFHNLNKKSINPVMTTLPNLVYTAKKYFRNFGKDFKNNCMNLASNIIGDFDNVNPNVIDTIVNPLQRRYKRETNLVKNVGNRKMEIKEVTKHVDKKQETSQNNKVQMVAACSNVFESDTEPKVFDSEHTLILRNSKETQNFQSGRKQKVKNKENNNLNNKKKELRDSNVPDLKPQYSSNFKNSKEENKSTAKKDLEKQDTKHDRYHIKPISKNLGVLMQKNSKETKNFREVASSNVRKKRYVIKVVDSDEVQSQVEQYLTEKLKFKPLFRNRFSANQPLVQSSHTQQNEDSEDYDYFSPSSEERLSKKKIQIRKVKPRVIIDNKGLAFMEYNGIKRPLLFSNRKKTTNIFKSDAKSFEEKDGKIDMLIQRAKEHTDLVGNTQNGIVPHKVIKERIHHLLNEIDHLVNTNLDNYDKVCEDLIKIHQIKISIEEDWKRLLIGNKVDDMKGKIEILEKFKDLQNVKNEAVKHIAETLQENNSEFVRKILISILAKLQRLQSLITSVAEDFETRFQTKMPFNTKKEIKFVDYLSDLKFITENTRNDLVKSIGVRRNEEVQKDIDILNKLKKFLHFEEDSEKLENTAKIIWEMMNACKMQKNTVKEMNRKLSRNQNVKKELKILFDLQNRFDEANTDLHENLGGIKLGKLENSVLKKGDKPQKKDIKDILADIKRKREEWVEKLKKGSSKRI